MAAKIAGKGGGKYDLGQNSEINVTPFVDVMLVLLIIFMVAAPMATVSIAVDLPPAVDNPGQKPKEPVFINVQESGALYIADRLTTLDTLPSDIVGAMQSKGVAGNFQNERVFIRADADVMYADFMAVLNVLQSNGFFKVGLINEDIS